MAVAFEVVPGRGAATAAAVMLHVVWVVLPIMASAMDATLDPRSFEALPLRSTELGRGLLAASVAGPGGLATVLFVVVGFGVGLWPGPVGVVTAPVLAALLVLISVVSGRLATTVISDLLARSRAGEIGSVVAGLLSGLAVLVTLNTMPQQVEAFTFQIPGWVPWLAVVPSGAVGSAFEAIAAGSWTVAVATAAWATVTLAGLVWAYSRSLDRLQTRSITRTAGKVGSNADVLGSRLGRLVPSAPTRVVAAKEVRYLRRDPRLRAQLLGGFVTVMVFGFVAASTLDTPFASFLAVLATWAVIAALVPNQFGADGGSFWVYVAAPTDLRAVLAGKNIALAVVAGPVAVTVGVAGAVVGGTAVHLVTAIASSAIVFFVWTAVGNITSVFGAFPLPERQLFGSNVGGSGRAVVVSLAGLAASGVLTGPAALGIGLAILVAGPGAGFAAAVAGIVYSAFVYGMSWRIVSGLAAERRFALIDALDSR